MDTQPTRVLIVEDDEYFAEYLRLHLLGLGFSVTAVTHTGTEALAAARATPPDIATIDVVLAGEIDGIETAERLREQHNIPILFLTAYQDPKLFERAKIIDPSAYLLKPFNERELRLAIELALHRHRVAQRRERRHEARHELLFRATPQPMWICDRGSGAFLDVNDAAVTSYGYSRDRFLGMSLGDVLVGETAVDKSGDPVGASSGLALHRRADGVQITVESSVHDIEYYGRPARIMLLLDVTQRLAAEAEVRRVSRQYRTLSARLLSVQEEERHHIARELHDEIGQSLTALKIALQSLGLRAETQPFRSQIELAVGIADTALSQVRQMSLDLRPAQLDDLGLAAAIRWNLQRQGQLAAITTEFSSEAVPTRLPEAVSIACYRVSQEAITNALRYSGATHLMARLWCEGDLLRLEVRDDGVGFDPALLQDAGRTSGSMGLTGMRERAALAGGDFQLRSAPGQGCAVLVSFPLAD